MEILFFCFLFFEQGLFIQDFHNMQENTKENLNSTVYTVKTPT